MKIFNAVGRIINKTADVIENVGDVVVLSTELAKDTIADEKVKRDISSAEELIEVHTNAEIDTDKLSEALTTVEALRAIRAGTPTKEK